MPSHYHGTVMQRTGRIEDTYQQIVREFRIQVDPTIRDILQPHVSLDDNQGSCLSRSECGGGQYHLVIYAFAKLAPVGTGKGHADAIAKGNQRLSDLRLEQHNNRYANVEEAVTENEFESGEILF